jgi:hypothetical protein
MDTLDEGNRPGFPGISIKARAVIAGRPRPSSCIRDEHPIQEQQQLLQQQLLQ